LICTVPRTKLDLPYSRWEGAYLRDRNFSGANLNSAILRGANLEGADLSCASLKWADLSGAKLDRADLSGANLSQAILREATGLGTRKEEQGFATYLLDHASEIEMQGWNQCIAAMACPSLPDPGPTASRAYPTLAQYFYSPNRVALEAIARVAAGGESVFP